MIRLGISLITNSVIGEEVGNPLDLNPYLYFIGSENVITDGGAVASWGQRSAGDNQLSRSLAQGTASLQPDNSGSLAVKFDGSDDKLAFDVAVAQAGILIVASSNGIFAYQVDSDSVDEITALGWEKSYFFDLDLYAYILLPASVTDAEIGEVISWLDENTDATKNPTGDLQNYFRNRTDAVSLKFDAIDFSGVTAIGYAFPGMSSLTSFPQIDTSGVTQWTYAFLSNVNLASFPELDTSNGTNFSLTWFGCSSLTSFPDLDFSNGSNFAYAWYNCTGLTSFPALDLTAGRSFQLAWSNCNNASFTSFPAITFSTSGSITLNFQQTWKGCSKLTSFPAFNLSRGTIFKETWRSCSSLSTFPAVNITAGTNFNGAWHSCTSLTTFPANLFDSWSPTSVVDNCFNEAWDGCTALTATSVENILNSLAAAGVAAPSSGVDITIDFNASSGTPSVASAVSTLKGLSPAWTITLNGVAQ